MMKNLLIAIFLFIGIWITSQVKADTMFVNGGNWIPLFSKSSYYIDSSNSKNVFQISQINNNFRKVDHPSNLILKKQTKTVWVHAYIKNTGNRKDYWLGIYSQLDILNVYRKTEQGIVLLKKYNISNANKQDIPDIRFHYVPFVLNKSEIAEIYMEIRNPRYYQNIYSDFTTPVENLFWENGFYWEIGFVIGVTFIIAVLSLVVGIILRRRFYFLYSLYLALIAIIVVREEFFINIIKVPFLYYSILKTNSLFLLVIAMGLSMKIMTGFLDFRKKNGGQFRVLNTIFDFYVTFGILASLWFYIDYANTTFDNPIYNGIWDISIGLSALAVLIQITILIWLGLQNKRPSLGILAALLFGFINPVTYFFNYSRILTIYEISHPNYFYYVLLLEIFIMGIAIAYSYRKIKSQYISTLEDKLKLEEENSKIKQMEEEKIKQSILESHEHLLKNLSKDLHDDIGQKLSIINFSVENLRFAVSSKESINEIRSSILEISDSVRDLSHWLNDFSIGKNTIDEIILNEVERIRKTNIIKINFEKINNSSENYGTSTEENIILYRCFQESINNILKHSDASQINIIIDYTNIISISIEDNGNGFDVNNQLGNGIKNIKERATLIGFSCTIQSNPEKGTKISIYKNDKPSNH
ncbi:signal transduction histidine kinase [Epilithonimonas hungarica]|uniref:sensor histidine kinase n=1 Tax=Epilithonimonas hungarica TaxID=454006 RepID=UPI00277E7377|nr:ATP-binding protein [Epilithonimonas hungarica]MDP9955708.1 signal transduction histidine kinase [Epilithonimonas hungarica]